MNDEQTLKLDWYSCLHCGWTYKPERGCPQLGLAEGTDFNTLGDDFKCPKCGSSLRSFAIRDKPY